MTFNVILKTMDFAEGFEQGRPHLVYMRLILCLLLLSLGGCVGIASMSGSEKYYTYDNNLASTPTKEKILKSNGSPSKIITESDVETWYYPNGLKWRGIVLWAFIVPIPLALPIGMDYTSYGFQNERCIFMRYQFDMPERGFMCGWMTYDEGHPPKLMCGSD
jgi:hypothetical protein